MKSIVFACLALALAASLNAQAQAQPSKIAVIYFQGAIVGTKDGQKAAAELDAKAAPKTQGAGTEAGRDQLRCRISSTRDKTRLSEAAKNELYKNIEIKKKSSAARFRRRSGRRRTGAAEDPAAARPEDVGGHRKIRARSWLHAGGGRQLAAKPGPLRIAEHRHHQGDHRAVRPKRSAMSNPAPGEAHSRTWPLRSQRRRPSRQPPSRPDRINAGAWVLGGRS